MAEPGKKPNDPYDEPGHEESEVPIRSHLKTLEGGGETTPREKGHLEPADDSAQGGQALEERENDFNYRPSGRPPSGNKHENQLGRGYLAGLQGLGGGRINKRNAIAGGVIGASLIGLIIAFFGLVNTFKLDGIMSNIDARTFARLHGVEDRRSLSWMQAYMQMRMMDKGDNPNLNAGQEDNILFRSNKVSTGSPIADWYRTMRASKFEADLLEKSGIKFTSVYTAEGKVRPGRIDIKGEKPVLIDRATGADFEAIARGDMRTLNKYQNYLDAEVFGNDKEARRAIREAVNNNTRNWEVFKRRHVRKAIQNMTGVRDWRFFEGTRDKFDEKKIDVRNKIIVKAVPESTKSGKFIHCLFGISDCVFNRDMSAPANNVDQSLVGDDKVREGDPFQRVGSDGKQLPPAKVDLQPAADAVRQLTSNILQKANVALSAANIVSTLDSISRIDKAIHGHQLSKGVAVARGVQAVGLYQTFETARDQIKTGEVNSQEVNKFMQVVGPAASSEAWTKVINGQGDASKTTDSQQSRDYCGPKNQAKIAENANLANQQFAYLCEDQQIGGSSKAADIEKGYNSGVGKIISPIAGAYNGLRDLPIIGDAADLVTHVIGSISGAISNAVLSVTGLKGPVEDLMAKVTTKLIAFLGAGPILNGNDSGGTYMNWLVQGGAYSAEASARSNGASLTTPATAALSQQTLALHNQDQLAEQSISQRYLAFSNSDSISSHSLLAISQLNRYWLQQTITSFASLLRPVLNLPFIHRAAAATDTGYRGADFAGIQTYDFPQQCLADPLNMTPQNATNVRQILGNVADNELTWDLVTSSEEWYQFIYGKIGQDNPNADTIAEKIYNCNLLDTSIRGSLGYIYGYSQDNGLDDSPSADVGETPDTSDACGVNAPVWGSVHGSGNEYSQEQLTTLFGNPGTEASHRQMDANRVNVDFLGHTVSIHKRAAACLKAVASEIQSKNIKYQIKQMGCYRFDSDNGSTNIGLRSYHTYGAACDINWDTNPFVGSGAPTPHDMPDGYVTAFHNHGFTWGGNWQRPKDYMHFEFNGLAAP